MIDSLNAVLHKVIDHQLQLLIFIHRALSRLQTQSVQQFINVFLVLLRGLLFIGLQLEGRLIGFSSLTLGRTGLCTVIVDGVLFEVMLGLRIISVESELFQIFQQGTFFLHALFKNKDYKGVRSQSDVLDHQDED